MNTNPLIRNIGRDRMDATYGDVYVGRPIGYPYGGLIPEGCDGSDGYFGSPFYIEHHDSRESILAKFEEYARDRIAEDPEYRARVRALHGKRLFCWCAPRPCHAEVLSAIAAELAKEHDLDVSALSEFQACAVSTAIRHVEAAQMNLAMAFPGEVGDRLNVGLQPTIDVLHDVLIRCGGAENHDTF